MTIKQQGGIFGRNPTFNDLTVEGTLSTSGTITLPADSVSGDAISGGDALLDTLGIGTASTVVNDLDLSGGNSGTPQIITMAQGNTTSKISTIKGQYGGVNEQGVIITSNYYGTLSESTFTSDGHLKIQKNLRLANTGYGIDFSGVNTAAEILDDYEEGTWTPAVAAGAISGTSVSLAGKYTKVGNKVTVTFKATNTAGDIQISSYASLSGLPYAASSDQGGSSTIITEDIDQFSRQGFAAVGAGSSNLALSAAGSSSGTVKLQVSLTYLT
jgi:hypothetical protein